MTGDIADHYAARIDELEQALATEKAAREAAERLHEALFDDNVALRAKLKRAMGVLYWLRTYSGETEKLVAAKLDEALR